jgi:hypothetical protein
MFSLSGDPRAQQQQPARMVVIKPQILCGRALSVTVLSSSELSIIPDRHVG